MKLLSVNWKGTQCNSTLHRAFQANIHIYPNNQNEWRLNVLFFTQACCNHFDTEPISIVKNVAKRLPWLLPSIKTFVNIYSKIQTQRHNFGLHRKSAMKLKLEYTMPGYIQQCTSYISPLLVLCSSIQKNIYNHRVKLRLTIYDMPKMGVGRGGTVLRCLCPYPQSTTTLGFVKTFPDCQGQNWGQ